MNQATAITSATETTTVSYDPELGLPQRLMAGDGETTHLCYYPLNATNDSSPQIKDLIAALNLDDSTATPLSKAMELTCAAIPDPDLPPLMAQCNYLEFPDGSVSEVTLALYGYAKNTKNQQGLLTPDTVLNLTGVTVDTHTLPWRVTTAAGRAGLSVSLQHIAHTESAGELSTTTTITTWYKDNNARQTRTLKETLKPDPATGTLHATISTRLEHENKLTTPIVSQHIRSARSGRVLRETQQDELGRPTSTVQYTYDASGRPLKSITSAYDSERFLKGAASPVNLAFQTHVWIDDTTGSWVRTTGPDGRCGRVLYDGLQRPVRWELQRTAGDDHVDGNYVCLQEQTYGADGEVIRQCVYDYLPGGLCLRDEGAVLPDNFRDWFWQADNAATTVDAQQGEVLATETLLGTMLKGPLRAVEMKQRNHRDGQVTLTQVHKRWNESLKKISDTGLSSAEVVNTKGQLTRVTETLPANVTRQWDTTYDELGRRTKINAPDGSVTYWTYQGLSSTPVQIRVVSKQGEEKVLGQLTLHGAGNQGDRVTAMTVGAVGSTLRYTFDDTGSVQPDNTRLYRVVSDDGNTVSWNAKKTTSTEPATLLSEFSFNAVTRAINTLRPATQDQLQGKISSTSLTPELLGVSRSSRVIRDVTQTLHKRHSLQGTLADVQHPSGVTSRAWTDQQNRRTRVRRGQLEYRYRYGAQGECEHLAVNDMRTGRKQTVDYAYDEFGRERERTFRLDDKVKSRYVQTWSVIGQLLSKAWYREGSITPTRTETFEYYTTDNTGRDELKSWSVDAVAGHHVTDTNGNPLTKQSYTYNMLGSLLTCTSTFVGGATETRLYGYDNVTQPTQRTSVSVSNSSGTVKTLLTYDLNGHLTTNQQQQTLTYTATGQLQSVIAPATSALCTTYEYDEFNRLAAQWDGANKQRRVLQYSDDQLCGEMWMDAQGKTIKQRVLDEEAGLVVYVSEGQGASEARETLFLMPDPQHGGGEEFSMGSNGEWQSRSVSFTPWGEAPLAGLNAMKSGLGYKGQRVDPVTGSYHPGHGYRVYAPCHQAFYQGDRLSPFGAGGLNDRAYCAGRDPVNWHDPSGHIMMSRREEASNLASLDDMIRDTTPPYHDPAAWWEWTFLGVFFIIAIIGAMLIGGPLGLILLIAACGSFAFGAASLALRQSNPALSEKLGWVSAGLGLVDVVGPGLAKLGGFTARAVIRGVQGLRSLRNVVKLHGVRALFKSSRSTNYLEHLFADTVKAGIGSKIPVSIARLRNLSNLSRPATPPATPGTSRAVVRRPQVTTKDFGKFELIHRVNDPSDIVFISGHGTNAIFGGKALVPPGSQLNLYAPAKGTVEAHMGVGAASREWLGVKAIISGDIKPTKVVEGNHYSANYKLSHFESNSEDYLKQIVSRKTIDIIRIKPGDINNTSLNTILKTLSQNGHNYKSIEGGFCRASEILTMIKQDLNIDLLPNRLITTSSAQVF